MYKDKVFTEFYNKWNEDVRERFIYLTNDIELSKDFTQDLFIKLKGRIETGSLNYHKSGKFLSIVAKNIVVDYYRKLKNRDQVISLSGLDLDRLTHLVDTSVDSIKDEIAYEENMQMLLERLNELDDKYIDVLDLRYLQGLSYNDISDILDVEKKTIINRRYTAIQKLKNYYVTK